MKIIYKPKNRALEDEKRAEEKEMQQMWGNFHDNTDRRPCHLLFLQTMQGQECREEVKI